MNPFFRLSADNYPVVKRKAVQPVGIFIRSLLPQPLELDFHSQLFPALPDSAVLSGFSRFNFPAGKFPKIAAAEYRQRRLEGRSFRLGLSGKSIFYRSFSK